MDFNSFVFPIPDSSYSKYDFKENLIWLPKKETYSYRDKLKYQTSQTSHTSHKFLSKSLTSRSVRHRHSTSMIQKIPSISFSIDNKFTLDKEVKDHIPCLFFKAQNSRKILVYFHANYEDLGLTQQVCSMMNKYLKVNVLSVEYPRYGVYKTQTECSAQEIERDAEYIYKFLLEIMNVEEGNILLVGRCIGSGPAVYLAERHSPGSLALISPFKSIKAAVKSIFDKFHSGWLFEKLVSERFQNSERIKKVKCPTLLIHGKKDEVIPWQHSMDLIKVCSCPAKLIAPDNMKHNNFDYKRDLIAHLKDFLNIFFFDDVKEIEKEQKRRKSIFVVDNFESSKMIDICLDNISTEEDAKMEEEIGFPSFMYDCPY